MTREELVGQYRKLCKDYAKLSERYLVQELIRQREEAEHRSARKHALRQQRGPDVGSLEYPFSFLNDTGYSRECNPIPGQPTEDIGEFPKNISHYYWINPGENDERPWLALCQLHSGIYVYYRGECDYTGFDCQGTMQIYASKDPNILIQMAMTSADYDLYITQTISEELTTDSICQMQIGS